MLKPNTRWIVEQPDEHQERLAAGLARELKLSPLAASLLVKRGMQDAESARAFLHGGDEPHDPFLLLGMREAVERIRLASERGELIRIYGDYDADGVSSTAFMTRLFTHLGYRFDNYVPHRTLEGYGLNNAAIDAAAAAGVKLIVTVDNGISAVDQIAHARSAGIDVVVTDHHEPPEELPEAAAIVNPKQPGCPYPFKGLAGVGVAFKLGQALLGRPPYEWAELAALGTVADLMPLLDENRIIVKRGLEQLRQTGNCGFRALAQVAGIDLASAQAETIAFGMAPRVNAAGRLEHANLAVRLLTTDDPQEALARGEELDALNRERQKLVDAMVKEAEEAWQAKRQALADAGEPAPDVIVVAGKGWNVGVVGIVASKLIERHYRPTFVLGIDPETGMCKGSARSIEGFDLHAAVTACGDLLDHFGGHQAAAGMSLPAERLAEFEARLVQLARERLTAEHRIRSTQVDLVCSPEDADLETTKQLALLEPFGVGNPQPKLLLQRAPLAEKRAIGKESKHLKLAVARGGGTLDAIGFGLGELAERLSDSANVDLVGELTVNEWNGNRKAQLLVRDIGVSHVQFFDRRGARDKRGEAEKLLASLSRRLGNGRLPAAVMLTTDAACLEAAAAGEAEPAVVQALHYDSWFEEASNACSVLILLDKPPCTERFADKLSRCSALEAIHALYERLRPSGPFPAREDFGRVYQALRRLESAKLRIGTAETALASTGWPPAALSMMLQVFEELEFLAIREERIELADRPAKRELTESRRYQEALRAAESERIWTASPQEWTVWLARTVRA